MITVDVLCPDQNESPKCEPHTHNTDEKPSTDRSRVTRLQVINLKGEVVDIEY